MKLKDKDIKWYNEGQVKVPEWDNYFQICSGAFSDKPLFISRTNGNKPFEKINPYTFITDPEYGFLDLFNKPDSPWQEGFWKWIHKMGYGCIDCTVKLVEGLMTHSEVSGKYKGIHTPLILLPTQMLTGYILEYLETDREEQSE